MSSNQCWPGDNLHQSPKLFKKRPAKIVVSSVGGRIKIIADEFLQTVDRKGYGGTVAADHIFPRFAAFSFREIELILKR